MTARTWTTDIIPTTNQDGTITVARGPLIDERVSYLRLLDMLDEASRIGYSTAGRIVMTEREIQWCIDRIGNQP